MYIGHILEEKHIEMENFDPTNIGRVAREVLAGISDPRRRQILENFIQHAEGECTGNYDALIDSLSEKEQVYAVYGCAELVKSVQPQSVEDTKDYYKLLLETNVHCIHGDVEKLIVGDDEIFVEIMLHQLYPGEMIPLAFGFDFGEEGEVYQLTQRVATVFVFDEEGKCKGEHSFTDGPSRPDQLRKEDPRKVPEMFWNNPINGAREKPF